MPMPTAVKNIPSSSLKKKTSLSRNASLTTPPTTATLSSDANARQVTRAEFQELTFVVAQLKKDLARNQTTASQLESELQLSNAQILSNKGAMGTLADLVLEKTNELQQQLTSQLQHLQVETNQRLTDMQLTLERLEFRFKHHVRDCQSIAEQVDLHQESLQTLRAQLGKTQNTLDVQREEQKTFVDTMRYTVSTSEAKAIAAMDECAKRLESFQQRMVAYIKKVEEDVQDPMKIVMLQLRDLELKDKRQGALIRQTLDELSRVRHSLEELAGLKSQVQRQHEHWNEIHDEKSARVLSMEKKLGKLLALVEKTVERAEMQRQLERMEASVKLRLEAVQELVGLCVESMTSSSSKEPSRVS